MQRFLLFCGLCHGMAGGLFAADVFDLHLSKTLRKGIANQKPLKSLSLDQAGRLRALSGDISSHCIVVKTNSGNLTKALVGWGFRRGEGKLIPVLLIERFVTYRGDGSNVAVAAGKDVMLFSGFNFNLDIGQVVPEGQGGDIKMTAKSLLEPIGKSELYGLNGSQLPPTKKGSALSPRDHDGVLPRDFSGTWDVDVDGRWKGELLLTVQRASRIRGRYTSADSKSTYPVSGRIAALPHNVKLTIKFDNTVQTIDAFLLSGDKSRLYGTATLAGRKFGFRAIRRKKNKPATKR
ncbi:MAG: hypothetical protein IID45_05625 [Planctomycetes bacterium]|nr:hypothetical protein [Planctomycetota bacterium]